MHCVEAFEQDDLGFTVVTCHCGVTLGPFPDDETAIDALMDHAYYAGRESMAG